MQFPKGPAFEESLIEAVKNLPILYDKNAVGYNNKSDIEIAWAEVSNEVSKKVKNVNVTHCKLRWRSLRDRYVKQFIKTQDGEILEPDLTKWEYNNQLDFLRTHLKKRKFGSRKLMTIPTKKLRPQPIIQIQRESQDQPKFSTSSSTTKNVVEIQKVETLNDNSCSGDNNSTIDEPETSNEIEMDDEEELNLKPKVSEIEFVPLQIRRQNTERPRTKLTEIVNDTIIDPIIDTYTNHGKNTDQKSTEECINNLMFTVNNLLRTQQKKEAETSPNEAYFKVLDGYFKKLPSHELDKVKVDILNLIMNKKKALERMRSM